MTLNRCLRLHYNAIQYPQHPWQSWRDRFIKKLKGRPPPSTVLENGPPTPPLDTPIIHPQPDRHHQHASSSTGKPPFTEEDAQWLLAEAEHISKIPPAKLPEAWGQIAEADQLEKVDHGAEWIIGIHAKHWQGDHAHTSEEWQRYWQDVVRPRIGASDVEQAGFGANDRSVHDDDGSVRSSSDHAPYLDAPEHVADRSSPIEPQHSSPAPSPQLPHRLDPRLAASAPFSEVHPEQTHESAKVKPSSPMISPHRQDRSKLKRKREDDPGALRRQAQITSKSPQKPTNQQLGRREIPSTPDKSPFKRRPRSPSPLFIQDDEEIDIKEEQEDSDQDDLFERYDLGQESEPFARGLLNTIAQMERQRAGTQDIFGDRSPTIDFGVALPEGGWDPQQARETSPEMQATAGHGELDEEDGGDGSEVDPDDLKFDEYDDDDGRLPSAIPETQGFFRDATPMPDFAVAEPEGGFDALEPPGTPSESLSSQHGVDTESSSSDYGAQLDVFIENAVAKGFPEPATLAALKSTSLDTELAKRTLERMRKGKRKSRGDDEWELPADWRGVWTEADDESITAVDGRVIERLIKKHGTESYDSRRQFLSVMQGS